MSYSDDARTAIPTPWFETPSNDILTGELGGSLDEAIQLDKRAVKMRLTDGALLREVSADVGAEVVPTAGDAERIRRIGLGFGMQRYPSESDDQFIARCDGAFPAYAIRSTAQAIIDQVRKYGIPDVEVNEEWMSTGIEGKPYESKFTVWLGPDYGGMGWGPMTLPFMLSETLLGLAGASEEQVSDVIRIILHWKNAFALPVALCFRFGQAAVIDSELYPLSLPFTIDGDLDGVEERPLVEPILDFGTILPFTLWGNYLVTLEGA